MKTDILKHLHGIYSVLQARINLINQSIGHAATQGAENEREIRRLLLDFLPSSYGIGSGKIVDTEGNTSNQIDIIIYDRSKPDYSLSYTSKIFLADHVIATIEIKSTFSSGKNSSLTSALENIASVKRLKVAPHTWSEMVFNNDSGDMAVTQFSPSPPVGIIFFFSAPDTQTARDLDRLFTILEREIGSVELGLQPDLLFSLDHAVSFRHIDIEDHAEQSQQYSVCLVPSNAADDMAPITLSGITPDTKFLADFSDTRFIKGDVINAKEVFNNRKTSKIFVVVGEEIKLAPTVYRIAKIGDRYFFLDNFRAFLNFIWAVEKLISVKHPSKAWSLTDYFGPGYVLQSDYFSDFADPSTDNE